MLQIVHLNGFEYFVDINNRILYLDSNKKAGTPFTFLTKDELKQVENELRFPRKVKEEIY